MAKKSKIGANERRKLTVSKYAEKRRALKELVRTADTMEERLEAQRLLSKLPRDASPTRVRNRDQLDGRRRAYLRKAGLSRVNFRERALRGELPGIRKASW
ncbi:small subunit ribosomal protein S14 [Trueperella bonasi]|uniref:Small ribosomal subunit protein uS14 n=1 Tax=Trueperella bonasi TaxID=312286 RepID=A0ABT9NHD7_9ACTO|nr:30S ribosomal protein S14 [Trueperella bonasi]MDP9806785.1 small subunit ribosomal protein S14 [Trueperella bonasi]